MDFENYIGWKHWESKRFSQVSPGNDFYFSQILNNKVLSKKRSKVLEVGFGNGELLGYLRKRSHDVVGVEINDNLVERANKAGYKSFAGLVWEIEELQFTKFDLIVAFDVAEHLSYQELNKLFSWVSNHLNNGGKLMLRFPEGASPFGLANQNGDFTHINSLTKGKIEALCAPYNMELRYYFDDLLTSNKLSSYGIASRAVLLLLQGYANLVKWLLKIVFYPITRSAISFATNSIVVITISRTIDDV